MLEQPTGLTATETAACGVLLAFTDASRDETAWDVEGRVDEGPWRLVARFASTTETTTGTVQFTIPTRLRVNRPHEWRVRARRGEKVGTFSAEAGFTPTGGGCIGVILTAPANLVATEDADCRTTLVFDDNSPNETDWEAEHRVDAGDWEPLGLFPSRSRARTGSVTLLGVGPVLAGATDNDFRVRAVATDLPGVSAWSNVSGFTAAGGGCA